MKGGDTPKINIKLNVTDHTGARLHGFHAWLYVGTGIKLGEGDVPTDGTALLMETEMLSGSAKLVVKGPASQDHPGVKVFEHVMPLSLRTDRELTIIFDDCPKIEDDTYTPAPLAQTREIETERADSEELYETRGDVVHLNCRTIKLTLVDQHEPTREYVAQPTLHGADWLCNAKTLVRGSDGQQTVTFNVRETATRTYLRIWPKDNPNQWYDLILRNLVTNQSPSLRIIHPNIKVKTW